MITDNTRTPSPTEVDTVDPPSHRSQPRPRISALAFLIPLQLFLAAGWFRAGIEKVIDPSWWTGDYLTEFLEQQREHMLAFFVPFADHVVAPLAPVVAWIVVWAQLAIGICLVMRRHARAALWAGIVLNLMFTMAGRVNPSAFYIVMQMTLLFALSRPIGIDIALRRAALWLIPALAVAPFARTLHPAEVIDDPALMLSFVSVLAAVTTVAATGQWDRLVALVATTRIGAWAVEHLGLSAMNPQDLSSSLRQHDIEAYPAPRT